jgi:hypothetical protein
MAYDDDPVQKYNRRDDDDDDWCAGNIGSPVYFSLYPVYQLKTTYLFN